ncbi:MAG TPA: CBS domain-containing protein [Candidatus Aminicenantes bacterium]|nr:CBS domain-containing protein [Candidatus Aminicenantes bacterium]
MKSFRSRCFALFNRFRQTDQIFLVVIPIFIGLAGGLGAAGLRFLIHLFEEWFWGPWGDSLAWGRTILVPTAGAFIVGLIVYYFSREAKGHGVPEVMEAISLKSGVIRPRVVFSKAVASAVTIASGGSVGREGPIVQIGSAIGSSFGQLFRCSRKRMQTLVGCGAAAGIAAAFNAPIAGAMFSVEILLGDFAVAQFTPIVISSVSATVVSRAFFGNTPAFQVPKYELIHPLELIPYAILGLLCGLVALLFIKVLYALEDRFDQLKRPDYIKTAMGGVIIGIYGISFPQVFGVGYEAMDQALLGHMPIVLLLTLVFVKILITSVTLGSGSSGGIFAPSLFMGAMTGGFFGHILHRLLPTVTAGSGAYALVAMSAVVGATTHAPITAILIIFEMTNDYKIILPLMIATTISSLMSTRLHRGSIYTLKLMRRGIHLEKGREINVLRSLQVADVMRPDIEISPPDSSLTEIVQRFIGSGHSHIYLTDGDGRINEQISQEELSAIAPDFEHLRDLVVAADIASPQAVFLYPDDNLDTVMRAFGRHNVSEIPVVDRKNPAQVRGTVWRIDVISAYNKEILRRDLAGEISSFMGDFTRLNMVEMHDGLFLLEIATPREFVGRRIRDLDIRNRCQVEVVMIKRTLPGKEIRLINPSANTVLREDDSVLILGDRHHVEAFSRL